MAMTATAVKEPGIREVRRRIATQLKSGTAMGPAQLLRSMRLPETTRMDRRVRNAVRDMVKDAELLHLGRGSYAVPTPRNAGLAAAEETLRRLRRRHARLSALLSEAQAEAAQIAAELSVA